MDPPHLVEAIAFRLQLCCLQPLLLQLCRPELLLPVLEKLLVHKVLLEGAETEAVIWQVGPEVELIHKVRLKGGAVEAVSHVGEAVPRAFSFITFLHPTDYVMASWVSPEVLLKPPRLVRLLCLRLLSGIWRGAASSWLLFSLLLNSFRSLWVCNELVVFHDRVVLGLIECSANEHAGHKHLGLDFCGADDIGLKLA